MANEVIEGAGSVKMSQFDTVASVADSDLLVMLRPTGGGAFENVLATVAQIHAEPIGNAEFVNGITANTVPTPNALFPLGSDAKFPTTVIPDLSGLYQPLDGDLTAIAALSTTGFLSRTGTNTWSLAGIVSISQGGTGQSTKATAFDALSPMSALGDLIYGGAAGTNTRLVGNTVATKKLLSQTGDGVNSAAPAWSILVAGDIPDLSATYSVKAGNTSLVTLGTVTTGTWAATAVGPTHGGTGLTSYVLGDVLYASAANTLSALAGNITGTKKFLTQVGTGSVSAAPSWGTLSLNDVPSTLNQTTFPSVILSQNGGGVLSLRTTAADNTGVTIGEVDFYDVNNSQTDKRAAYIRTDTAGSTANNRGGAIIFGTRANNTTGPLVTMELIGISTLTTLFLNEPVLGNAVMRLVSSSDGTAKIDATDGGGLLTIDASSIYINPAVQFGNTVLLNQDPTLALQAATKQYVDAAGGIDVLKAITTGPVMSWVSTTSFSVASNSVGDSTYTSTMILASATTKTTSSWAVGSGNGGLDTGSIAASTWYSVWQIKRVDTGVVDILFSTSATSPTMPTNYTLKRRIGWVRTDGSSHFLKFYQFGREFYWDVKVSNYNAASPNTSRNLITVTAPISTIGIFDITYENGQTGPNYANFGYTGITDAAASVSNSNFTANPSAVFASGQLRIEVDASNQIFSRVSNASDLLTVLTEGWVDYI